MVPQLDLFVKLILEATPERGHLVICHLKDLVSLELCLLGPGIISSSVGINQVGAVGSVGVLTRCCLPEIRAICPKSSTSFSIHCVGTPWGTRNIALHFFTPGHCHLFQFTLDKLASPGACPWLPISTTCIAQRIDYARCVLSSPFHGGPYGTLGAGSGLEIEDLEVVSGRPVLFISRTLIDAWAGVKKLSTVR